MGTLECELVITLENELAPLYSFTHSEQLSPTFLQFGTECLRINVQSVLIHFRHCCQHDRFVFQLYRNLGQVNTLEAYC